MIIAIVLFLILLLFFPSVALSGSRYGLTLWMTELVPVLLPFFITIRLFKATLPNIAKKRIFLLCGLLCGYPAGASLVTGQYNDGLLTKREAYFYLGFVNNPSPMFTMAFCGQNLLFLNTWQCFLLLGINITASFLGSLLFYVVSGFRVSENKTDTRSSLPKQQETLSSALLDQIILDSFFTLFKIGGYVILFSILGQLLFHFVPMSVYSVLGSSMLEISSGASYLRKLSVPLLTKKVLMSGILAFGGLSAAFQTGSILTGSGLKLFPYILIKLLNGICATVLSLLWLCLF